MSSKAQKMRRAKSYCPSLKDFSRFPNDLFKNNLQ